LASRQAKLVLKPHLDWCLFAIDTSSQVTHPPVSVCNTSAAAGSAPQEQSRILRRFRAGDLNLLVSTSGKLHSNLSLSWCLYRLDSRVDHRNPVPPKVAVVFTLMCSGGGGHRRQVLPAGRALRPANHTTGAHGPQGQVKHLLV
jgi:hypothetical protein